MKTKTKKAKVKSPVEALAKQLGTSRQLVNYHLRQGCEIPLDDVEGWKDFIVSHGRDGLGDEVDPGLRRKLRVARLHVLEEQRIEKQLKNANTQLQHYDADRCERFITHLSAAFFGEFERVFEELPQVIPGKDLHAIRDYCRKEKQTIQDILRARLQQWHDDNAKLRAELANGTP